MSNRTLEVLAILVGYFIALVGILMIFIYALAVPLTISGAIIILVAWVVGWI